MLVRQLVIFLLVLVAARVLRAWLQSAAAQRRRPGGSVPPQGVEMVRDPVCGTYVVPGRSMALTEGSQQVYFCSAECRDKYRGGRSKGRSDYAAGRTA
jgi:uncharacterized protein